MKKLVSDKYIKLLSFYRMDDYDSVRKGLNSAAALSRDEKFILQMRLLINEQKWKEAQSKLEKRKKYENEFLKAESFLLLSYIYYYLHDHESSIVFAQKSIVSFLKSGSEDQQSFFLAYFNLATIYQKIGLYKTSILILDEASEYCDNQDYQICLLQNQAECYMRIGDSAEAMILMAKAEKLSSKVSPYLHYNVLLVFCDFAIRNGKLVDAKKILRQMKSRRAQSEIADVILKTNLLEAFLESSTLGPAPLTIQKSKEHSLKWSIIRNAQQGLLITAQQLWNQLRDLYPRVYHKDFGCFHAYDQQSLFIRCLDKYRKNVERQREEKLEIIRPFKAGSRLDQLFEVVYSSSFALSKENIISQLWPDEYSKQLESRFYKLVQRFNKSQNIYHLKNIHGRYELLHNKLENKQ